MNAATSSPMAGKIETSIAKVREWVEKHDYKAYDRGDGNLSYLHALTFNILFLERLLNQSAYRAPFNVRPLYGINPHTSIKGMGYFAWGYLKLFALKKDAACRDRAVHCLEWLIKNKSPGYPQYSWGNHFPFCTRGGKTPALEPIVPWTTLIAQAFLEAYRLLGEQRYLDVAVSAGDWILSLPREKTGRGTCISYHAFKQSSVHNSNLLAAALLAQVGLLTGNGSAMDLAKDALSYSCLGQQADGAWYYGEAANVRWIDNFHTGYNLDCLKRYREATGDYQFDAYARRGLHYFKKHFFEDDGCPKYYHNKKYPVDIQCAAQAIDTLTLYADGDLEALDLAKKVAGWTIDHMQARDGHFYYRDLGWAVNKTPMLHWGQGTMFKALAHLSMRLSTDESDN